MDRDELLEREHASWSAFEAAVGRVPPDRRAVDGVVPGWSVKDLIWALRLLGGVLRRHDRGEGSGRPF
jgi:hypothetical protein